MSAPEVHEGVVLPPSNGGQPVLSVGAVVALVAAGLGLLASFGLPVTDTQERAIVLVVTLAAPIVAALIARRKVTPNGAVSAYVTVQGQVVAGEARKRPGSLVTVRPQAVAQVHDALDEARRRAEAGEGDAVGGTP